jgi:hypothetical protein
VLPHADHRENQHPFPWPGAVGTFFHVLRSVKLNGPEHSHGATSPSRFRRNQSWPDLDNHTKFRDFTCILA